MGDSRGDKLLKMQTRVRVTVYLSESLSSFYFLLQVFRCLASFFWAGLRAIPLTFFGKAQSSSGTIA